MSLSVSCFLYVMSLFSIAEADITDIIKLTIKKAITPTIGKNRAVWYAWHDSKGHSFSDAIGYSDRDQMIKANITDQVPMGSLCKSYVATALMRVVDQNKLHIDDKLIKHVDPWLTRYMNLSLSTLFPGPNINKVTIRELMHMSSGLIDYNDYLVWDLSVHLEYDLTPYIYLTNPEIFSPSWLFPPGEGIAYSSVGFMLAGMVLASIVDKPWNEVMASDFFPQNFMNASRGFRMTGEGPCSKYDYVPHTYSFNKTLFNKSNPSDPYPSKFSKRSYFVDMYHHSCLNGWMFGNIITTAWDSAYYFFSLFSSRTTTPLVTDVSLNQMTDFDRATTGLNLTYGLGTMEGDFWWLFKNGKKTPDEFRYWVGHAGIDYGSSGLGFYIPGLDGAISIMWNSDPGSKTEYTTLAYSACKIGEIIVNSLKASSGPEASCGISLEEFDVKGMKLLFA
jgi:CubicO group peptidase (beta-lactamase class C family)